MSLVLSMLCYLWWSVSVILLGIFSYNRLTIGMCRETNSLEGKTVLITGGNSGIGFEAAKEFARRGARLLLPCRDQAKARAAIANIIKDTGNEDITLFRLDISSLQSVEDFAEELMSLKDTRIHILCLHAGCFPTSERQTSVDGFEYTFATNHLGHFHLTNLVKHLLAPSARIIITSSKLYQFAQIDFSDLQQQRRYSRLGTYSASKLMNIYHMRELSARLSTERITANAIHPGLVNTNFFRGSTSITWILGRLIVPIFGKTPLQGAQTLIQVAVSEKLQGASGLFFSDCQPCPLTDKGLDKEAPPKLWTQCEKMIAESKDKRHGSAAVTPLLTMRGQHLH